MSIPSPCIDLCRLEAGSGLCQGCLRTADEIAGWAAAPEAQRRRILAAIERRRACRDSPPGETAGGETS